MKKLFGIVLALVLAFGLVGSAQATPVQITYTADNIVNFFLSGTGPVYPLGPHWNDWRVADTLEVNLGPGSYSFTWEVYNTNSSGTEAPSGTSTTNPSAFLGQITDGINFNLSSIAWEVSLTGDTGTWFAATAYANNTSPAIGNQIWANNGGPISGISGDAWWIGFGAYPGVESFYVRTTFDVATVPLPGAVWLLGSGLVGLVGLRRKLKS